MQPESTGQTPNSDSSPDPSSDPALDPNQAASPPPEGEEIEDSQRPEDEEEMDELTNVQIRSIELAIQGVSDVQIAKALGISRKTLWRWKTLDRDYRRVLSGIRLEAHSTASDRYHILLNRATIVLSKFMEGPSDQNQFKAARIVLAMAGCFKPVLSKAEQSELDYLPVPYIPPEMG